MSKIVECFTDVGYRYHNMLYSLRFYVENAECHKDFGLPKQIVGRRGPVQPGTVRFGPVRSCAGEGIGTSEAARAPPFTRARG